MICLLFFGHFYFAKQKVESFLYFDHLTEKNSFDIKPFQREYTVIKKLSFISCL